MRRGGISSLLLLACGARANLQESECPYSPRKTIDGRACTFPFEVGGVVYDDCTFHMSDYYDDDADGDKHNGDSWCVTGEVYDSYDTETYGTCAPCPVCTVSKAPW